VLTEAICGIMQKDELMNRSSSMTITAIRITLVTTRSGLVWERPCRVLQNNCGEIPHFPHALVANATTSFSASASLKTGVLQNICGEVLRIFCGSVAE
jgi:hypothetical protein